MMCVWVGRCCGVAVDVRILHCVMMEGPINCRPDMRVVRRTSTKLPSHLDDVDGWHRLVELQQTNKKQKSDSPLRGSFHQRPQSFGTGWLPAAGCICSARLLYIRLRAVRCNAHGDECASFCSVAVQYVEMEAIRVLAQGMTSSQGLILIL